SRFLRNCSHLFGGQSALFPGYQPGTTTRRNSSILILIASLRLPSPNLFTIQLADEWGMTRIDYARPERFIIYTHAERIIESAYLQYSFGWFRENSASLKK
ncbi:MAG: hypothetical protein ABFD17_00760, partial [Anaerolineaceae bacterium]